MVKKRKFISKVINASFSVGCVLSLSAATVMAADAAASNAALPATAVYAQQTKLDQANEVATRQSLRTLNIRWYPKYHVAAPVGWINDPNGLCYYGGQYHVFYQYHPYSAQWGPMHWGHVTSTDLVHWKDEPVAIAPDRSYDANGCFSGSAIEKDGKLYIMYTGHVDLPADQRKNNIDKVENQCLAVSSDGIHFDKVEGNPVIPLPKDKGIYGTDFRDPMMWKHDGKYYTVVGAKAASTVGQVLLFRSDDLIEWDFVGSMAKAEGNEGHMWECPNFTDVDGHDVLIFSPQDVQPEGDKYRNVDQSVYMLGNLNYDTGEFKHGEINQLDRGFDFYAPQVFKAADGRVMMLGWLDMWGSAMPEQQDGWSCMMTVPRELHYKDGKLITAPARELLSLRRNERTYEQVEVTGEKTLDSFTNGSGEFDIDFNLKDTDGMTMHLETAPDERMELSYDKKSGIFRMDRRYSGQNADGVRRATVKTDDGHLRVRGFVDRSSLEVFINGGETVFSSRVYPSTDKTEVKAAAKGGTLHVDKASFYALD